jgi:hypothetical protein
MMSLFGMFLDSLMSAPDKQEVEDLEWEDEHPTKDQDMNQGRSLITGY